MSDVRMVKLGKLITSSGYKAKNEVGLPVYSVTKYAGFIRSSEYFTKQVYSKNTSTYKVVQPGEFAYATIHLDEGSIGIAPEKCIISPMYTVFKITSPEALLPDYLIRILKSPPYLVKYSTLGKGSVNRRKSISLSSLENLEIPLPNLKEQKRIVDILNKIKLIQEARERQLAALDRLKHSLLQETIKSSTTQEIPVGKVISLKSGSFLPAKKQDGGKFPVYGGNGVNGSHSQYMVEEPTIIIGRVGAYCGSVHITRPKSWITDNALIVTIQAEGILQKYLANVLHSINLNQYANRSGQPSISATRIKDIFIPIIPLTKQENFTKNINNIDRQIYLIRKSLEEDKVLFLSLQSVLFKN